MMPTRLLTSPPFVLAIATLLVNDWLLKPIFGTWWTGKLSDVAGLFAFAVFWCALAPARRTLVVALTAIGFALWKSPLTDAPLAAWNALGIWPLARVVDYTDWLALAMLPLAWLHVSTRTRATPRSPVCLLRRVGAVASAAVAVVAFSATSVPQPRTAFPEPQIWTVSATPGEVLAELRARGFDVRQYDGTPSRVRGGVLVYAHFPIGTTAGGAPVEVGTTLELVKGETRITLHSASSRAGLPRADVVRQIFVEDVIGPLQARYPARSP